MIFLAIACLGVQPLQARQVLESHIFTSSASGEALDLIEGGLFGAAVANMGDIDGDGVVDLAVGAPYDFDQQVANHVGAVWFLFLNESGHVKAHYKLTPDEFLGTADFVENFGSAVASLGDLDGDAVNDIAIGDPGAGTVWIITLNANGSRKDAQNIILQEGEVVTADRGVPTSGEAGFGASVTGIGDLDGDGEQDLAVGDAENQALWIVFLNADKSVKAFQKIDEAEGGFEGDIAEGDRFGAALTSLGDLNGDGVVNLAVGAPDRIRAEDNHYGAVWLLNMTTAGTVNSHVLIRPDLFTGTADPVSSFGSSLSWAFDPDGEHAGILYAGSPPRGTLWRLLLTPDGVPTRKDYLAEDQGSIMMPPDPTGGKPLFGQSVADLGDLNGDGVRELAIGNPGVELGPSSLWIYFENQAGQPLPPAVIGDAFHDFTPPLADESEFGTSVVNIGDLDGDGSDDLAVGSPPSSDGKRASDGAIWLLFLDEAGGIKATQELLPDYIGESFEDFGRYVSAGVSPANDPFWNLAVGNPDVGYLRLVYLNANGTVNNTTFLTLYEGELLSYLPGGEQGTPGFGTSMVYLGDMAGDGGHTFAVGQTGNQAVWIVFFDQFGSITGHQRIAENEGGFTGVLAENDGFGSTLASVGDLDGNGAIDLAVGAPGTDDISMFHKGAVWIVLLKTDGTVKSHFKLLADSYFGTADPVSPIGWALSGLGDQNGDGIGELALGISDRGTVVLLSLQEDGSVRRALYLARMDGGVEWPADPTSGLEGFGSAVADLGDRNGDGLNELAVGSPLESGSGLGLGALWAVDLCLLPEPCSILPVELTSFDGRTHGDAIELTWTTQSELNNARFAVERSVDLQVYGEIGSVEGQGTTLEPHHYAYTDRFEPTGVQRVFYRLKQVDFDGAFTYSATIEVPLATPQDFELSQNFPNPFNPETLVEFSIPVETRVRLVVYDLLGRERRVVFDETKAPGGYRVRIDGRDLPSGVYLYRLEAGDVELTRTMLLAK